MKGFEITTLAGLTVISANKAELLVYTDEGETIFEMALPPGLNNLGKLEALSGLAKNVIFRVTNSVYVRGASGRTQIMPYGEGKSETAANPNWEPSASEMQRREMLKMVNDAVEKSLRKSKKKRKAKVEKENVEEVKERLEEDVETTELETKQNEIGETANEEEANTV